ncbi:MAG TPA: hypothetical protein VMS96_10375, partial [Terriglobales bacterium]|nr:hypothetical protein [Terriglobales bacterium]
MKWKPASTVLFTLVFSCLAMSQQVTAIRAGHLVDPATGKVADNRVIVIKDGKVESVGGSVPAGAQVIDLSKQWVMPGLMDAHTHITMDIPPAPPDVSSWEAVQAK